MFVTVSCRDRSYGGGGDRDVKDEAAATDEDIRGAAGGGVVTEYVTVCRVLLYFFSFCKINSRSRR